MKQIASHHILVSGISFASCRKQVTDFFDRTLLVRYDRFTTNEKKCIPGIDPSFLDHVERGIEDNKNIIKKLVKDLEGTGMETTSDLLHVEHGYPSKLLHIITHFLDGFIGIDTVFYNLIDDSHWIPEATTKDTETSPDNFWLIHINGFSETPEKAALVQR